MKAKEKEQASYPVAIKDFSQMKLPRLGRKKRALHTKNPYKVKKEKFVDEDKKPRQRLDGFLLLKVTKNDLPHEIVRANLSKLQIVETNVEDTRYFINLLELDVSENEILLEDLVFFQNLVHLRISANKIDTIKLSESHTFENLETLDLSFNQLFVASIECLAYIPKLKRLSLEQNDLRELPEDLSRFAELEELNLANNLFQSDQNAAALWRALASIRKLKVLNLAHNALRGVHTEKLVAGDFMNLETLDFSYNAVENQHNLICARNFRKLKYLIITGNPFAIIKEHKGLEMEVYARTGAEVVNEELERPYLKPKREKGRSKIKFDSIITVENDVFAKDRNYFMGIEMPREIEVEEQAPPEVEDVPQDEEEQLSADVNGREREIMQQQMDMSSEDDGVEDAGEEGIEDGELMYMTELPERGQKKQKPSTNNNQPSLTDQQASASLPAAQQQQAQVASKDSLKPSVVQGSLGYEEFLVAAHQHLGDSKEYEQHYDLNTAYKTLKNVIKRPDSFDYKDFSEPNYLKPTAAIKRYKPRDQSGSSILKAESFEKMESQSKQQQQQKNNTKGSENQSRNGSARHSQSKSVSGRGAGDDYDL